MILALAASVTALADEGMWMMDQSDRKSRELAGAIVSYDFMGTGSLISDNGLVITNHHVVYSDVFELSSADRNYLENGFWARSLGEELPIPGRSVQILVETIDVTAEVEQLIAEGKVKKGPMMMRRLGGIMEKKYEQSSGKMAILSSMWRGCRYYISLYDNYSDVRLVAAPPSCIGAFGGDVDNWEWPQQKGDFSMVRIYTAPDGKPAEYSPDNVPMKSPKHLKISDKGVREGSSTRVMGFPGRTDRYASAAKVKFQTYVTLPVTVKVRGDKMDVISKWMNADPQVRLKYADAFFSLSNAQELYSGEIQCYKRFDVVGEKRAQEEQLNRWIAADPDRKARWGTLTADLDRLYDAVAEVQRQETYYRECISRASKLSPIASRTSSLQRGINPDRVKSVRHSGANDYAAMDMRVEHDIFRGALESYMENVSPALMSPFQSELKERFGSNYDAMCEHLWRGSWMTDPAKVAAYLDPANDMAAMLEGLCADPLCRFFVENKIATFNEALDKIMGEQAFGKLANEYTCALYTMRNDLKIKQYPDANSTLRLTTGSVKSFWPRDAVFCDWKSTVAGLLEKHNPDDHDFCLEPEWKKVLESVPATMPVNFITDNDITGGNSGSPVLDSKGRVVGLAFDGNKESLAGDTSFTKDYNRCICVDIRFVMMILDRYAHLDNILAEIAR